METSKEAYDRITKLREARKNRNWFTKHDTALVVGSFLLSVLLHLMRQDTAANSPAEMFLMVVGTVNGLFGTVLLAHILVEFWRSLRESRELSKIIRTEDEESS